MPPDGIVVMKKRKNLVILLNEDRDDVYEDYDDVRNDYDFDISIRP